MRTTLSLDDDVLDKARELADVRGRPFREVVNEALRSGLQELEKPVISKPYRIKARDMGLRPGIQLDNIQELLSEMEGEDRR